MKKLAFVFTIVVLLSGLLAGPALAQKGSLGQPPTYPDLPQKYPNYILLVAEPTVTLNAEEKTATISFETAYPVPAVRAYYGPYMPEQVLELPRFRRDAKEELEEPSTTHSITINLGKFEAEKYDVVKLAETGRATIAYRLEIYDPKRLTTRFYDSRFTFENYELVPTISEGPFVDMVTETGAVISWDTDVPTDGLVRVGVYDFESPAKMATHHEVEVSGLNPGQTYPYVVEVSDGTHTTRSREFSFQTVPLDATRFRFAIMSDSREGVGGGERAYNGVNYETLNEFMIDAYNNGANFILFGGDLVNGYTTSVEDFKMQFEAWKDAVEPVGHYIPIYEGMGNHEIVMDVYDDGSKYGIEFDKVGEESAEAVFASQFVNPTNGPEPETEGAPPYKENVYYFDYGNSRFISVNTNYWWCNQPEQYGGNLEGYVMDGQLEWIKGVLADAAADPNIIHIFLFAHEPAFPNGGHLKDAQWYHGGDPEKNNGIDRTYVVERRDELWQAISESGKAVAMFFGDEHNYNRTLIDAEVNPAFVNPVWQIISGGAGAPFYGWEKDTPWVNKVHFFSAQKNYCLITVDGDEVLLEVIGDADDVIDRMLLTQ